jgi:hypothetical protein
MFPPKEIWRDENAAERQRGAFKERWGEGGEQPTRETRGKQGEFERRGGGREAEWSLQGEIGR